jgi:hypothetical protein
VQEISMGQLRHRSVPREDIPLRGLIRCSCGAALTGGFSKGRKKYYLYYKCTRERKHNYCGDILQELFNKLLNKLFFTDNLKVSIEELVKEKSEESLRGAKLTMITNRRGVGDIERKIEKLEALLINDDIEPATYRKWCDKLRQQKTILLEEADSLNKRYSIIRNRFEELLPLLLNIGEIFKICSFHSKQKLIRKVFEAGLIYDGKRFITSYIHPALNYAYNKMQEEGLLLLRRPLLGPNNASSYAYPRILTIDERQTIAEQHLAIFIVELIMEDILEKM